MIATAIVILAVLLFMTYIGDLSQEGLLGDILRWLGVM